MQKILIVHNEYQFRGGEATYVSAQIELLQNQGHKVHLLVKNNQELQQSSPFKLFKSALNSAWNPQAQIEIDRAIDSFAPDLLHAHNFFPLWSPAIHHIAQKRDIPTIQHLHNYRLGCLNSCLFRNNQICELCVGKNPWRGVLYQCYRNSFLASGAVWYMLTVNRWRNTWIKDVSMFLTPSHFSAQKLIEIGLPAEKMRVLPNFVSDPLANPVPSPTLNAPPTFLFVGRLSAEKGIMHLLQAWSLLSQPEWRLQIVGDGLLLPDIQQFIQEKSLTNVQLLGRKPKSEVQTLMQNALAVLVPSICYETFGLSVIEGWANGKPVLASDIGALRELIADGVNGWRIPPYDRQAWVDRLRWCGEHLSELALMGRNGRSSYLAKYTPAKHYEQLINVYRSLV
jgi:glycosyltransferase involved in cell wall biosynthesis